MMRGDSRRIRNGSMYKIVVRRTGDVTCMKKDAHVLVVSLVSLASCDSKCWKVVRLRQQAKEPSRWQLRTGLLLIGLT